MYVNEAAAIKSLVDEGIISAEKLQGLGDFAIIQESLGDHYDVVEMRGGKAGLDRISQHGMSNSRDNLNALLMAVDAERNGPIVVQRPGLAVNEQGPAQMSNYDKELGQAITRSMGDGGLTALAKPGLRSGAMTGMPGDQKLYRAINYARKIGNGYDPINGSRLTMGLDGGHIFPHNKYPELSASDFNINPENQYVNRAKGNREGAELISSLTNSFNKKFGPKTKDGAVPIRRMANLWNIGRGF